MACCVQWKLECCGDVSVTFNHLEMLWWEVIGTIRMWCHVGSDLCIVNTQDLKIKTDFCRKKKSEYDIRVNPALTKKIKQLTAAKNKAPNANVKWDDKALSNTYTLQHVGILVTMGKFPHFYVLIDDRKVHKLHTFIHLSVQGKFTLGNLHQTIVDDWFYFSFKMVVKNSWNFISDSWKLNEAREMCTNDWSRMIVEDFFFSVS